MDIFGDFLEDCDFTEPGWYASKEIMAAYQEWAGRHGVRYLLGPHGLADRLRAHGFKPEKRGGERGWERLA